MPTITSEATGLERIFYDFAAFTELSDLLATRRFVESAVSEVEGLADTLHTACASRLLDELKDSEQPQADAELAWHLHYLAERLQDEAERLAGFAKRIDKAASHLWLSREIVDVQARFPEEAA